MAAPRYLSRETILHAALRLVDEEGLDALTMRRLGNALGVEAMSLYYHMSNKDEILGGVLELLFRRLELPTAEEGQAWSVVAKDIVQAFRRLLLAHPNVVPLFATRSITSPEAIRTVELSLRTLRRAGFDDGMVVDGHRLLMSFALGYVMSEVSLFSQTSIDPNSWGTAAYALHALPVDEVPNLAKLAPLALGAKTDEQFSTCLDLILLGLETRLSNGNSGATGQH